MGRSHLMAGAASDPRAAYAPSRAPPFPARIGIATLLLTIGLNACERSAPRGALDLDDLPQWSAEAELRIGSVDDASAGFSRVLDVDVDRDGRLYVFEAMEMQIRVYSAEGRLLRRIGRRGDGPGEFRRVARFGVVGDTLWTFDYSGDRITLLDREGTLLSTGRVESWGIGLWNQCYGYVMPWTMRPDGLFSSLFGRVSCNPNSPAPEIAATDSVPVPRVLFDATGAVVDTIGQDGGPPPRMARPRDPSEESSFQVIQIDGASYVLPTPPMALPRWIRLHDGRIVMNVPIPESEEGALTLTRIGLQGDTVYHRRYTYEADRYTSAELDALAAEAAAQPFAGGGGAADPAVQAQLRARMSFPEFRPTTQSAQVDEEGRNWILRDDPEGSTTRFAVLDTAALPLGELALAGDAQLVWSRGDVAWFVENDELDVPWLVRYRIGGL